MIFLSCLRVQQPPESTYHSELSLLLENTVSFYPQIKLKPVIMRTRKKHFTQHLHPLFDTKDPSSSYPLYTFWFQIVAPGCCGNCTVTFFWGRTAGAASMCKKGTRNSQSSYFFFRAQEGNVAEEVQLNVTVGKGHPCPGSLLHTPASSHTATNDVFVGADITS